MTVRVMGILDLTPDSFSDGRRFSGADDAIVQGTALIDAGADMVEVRGGPVDPLATPVPPELERDRVVPVVEALAGLVRISVGTRHAGVARAAVGAGATVICDVGATLGAVAADLGAGWIAVHAQGPSAGVGHDGVVDEVTRFLGDRAAAARGGGVVDLWVDPGLGLGKAPTDEVALVANLDRLVVAGWPVAIEANSVATATYGMVCGAELLRVHDVTAIRQAATVFTGESERRRT